MIRVVNIIKKVTPKMPYWNEPQAVVVKKNDAEDKLNALKRLRYDIRKFIESSPVMTPSETAKAICSHWQGYRQDYGEKEIEEIVQSRIWVRAER